MEKRPSQKIADKWGLPEDSKFLMIHADDAGLSHSQNRATKEALVHGQVNSYSIMVPCPWFYEIAQFARNNPALDNGIHLTLTCEWENYKFGPVLPISEVPSLVDENGFFYRNRNDLKKYGMAEEVARELEAQIRKGLQFGLRPTHLDSHMYSVGAHPQFLRIYKDLGKKYGLPVLLGNDLLEMVGLEGENDASDFVFDTVCFGKFADFERGGLENYYDQVLDTMEPGIHMLLVHPAHDDAEMKGITVNHPNFGSAWRQRDLDYLTGSNCRDRLRKNNITMISWNEIKKLLM